MYKMIELGRLIKQAKTIRCGEEKYPVLSMTMHEGLVFQNEKFKKIIASKDTSDYKVVFRNQLVISFPIDEGVLATQRIVDAGIVSPAYSIWDINQTLILPEFLEYALRSERSIEYYKAHLRGSTARRRSLPTSTLLALTVPLPNLDEQEKILQIIYKIKDVIRGRKEEIYKLEIFTKGRFVEMFGSIHESTKYPYLAVKEFADVVSGGTPSRDRVEFWNNGTIPWVKTTELQNNVITSVDEFITEEGLNGSSAKIVPANTVLIAMYGQGKTRGMTGFLGIEASTNQACACILPSSKINAIFLWKYFELSYDKLRDMAKGGNQPNLNGNMIKSFPVLMPPMTLQEEYVEFVKQVDKLKFLDFFTPFLHYCIGDFIIID